jgi:protein-serine/threonine kinase
MLRGLLMRRQSSQVSTSGTAAGSQQFLPLDDDPTSPIVSPSSTAEPSAITQDPVYGDPAQDAGNEVRFSVELTRLSGLNDTFSLDIRRLKGNLRSYKFLYDTLRE